jgi:UDP-N-acetylmuramoyl-tripeptide--D-alanyl-D-alanine ligase
MGCSYAIVDETFGTTANNILVVEDVLKTLQALASYHRLKLGTTILAITGTNGKTTTKELVYSVVSSSMKAIATEGNLNNHIGVPLTLLRLKKEHEFGIIEMGANHQGEIAFLCEIAHPNIGLITNVGKAHLEGFGSFEIIKKTKGELYDYLKKSGGQILINADNENLIEMVGKTSHLCYSTISKKGLAQCVNYRLTPYLEVGCTLESAEIEYHIKSKLIGSYNLENIIAAIAIGVFLKIEISKIIYAIENYTPNNNRSQLTQTSKNTLLIDCYNANPSSMNVALSNFIEIEHPSKMLILGEMRELGNESVKEHSILIDKISKSGLSEVYLVGQEFLDLPNLPPCVNHFGNSEALCEHLKIINPSNKLVLIKGSRGNRLEKVIDSL